MSDVADTRGLETVPASGMARPNVLSATAVALMAAGVAAWTAAVGGLAAWRHAQFLSHRADLGSMVQAVWSTTQGRLLEVTDGITGEQVARLAGHVDPILVLYVPLWLLHSSPETLIVAQAAILATGVYPVVRLALKHSGSRFVAGLMGAWYLSIPWVVWLAFNELNAVTLALPFLLHAIWFLDEHRLRRFGVFAALAMLTGELVGLTVAGLGVWYAIKHRRVRASAGIVLAGVAWTAICLTVVIPAFNEGRPSAHYDLFQSVGGSPGGLLRTVFTDPGAVVTQMTTWGDIQYVLWLVLPTALLFLGRPLLLLAALPQLAVNLLAEFPATVSPLYHYSAPVVAALVGASIMALGRVPSGLRVVAAVVPLFLAVVLLGSIPPRPGQEAYLFPEREPPGRRAAMQRALELVPARAPVMTTNHLGAQLSARRVVQAFPRERGVEWAVVDSQDPPSRYAGPRGRLIFDGFVARLHRDPDWRLVFESEGIRVYRRPT